MQRHIHHFQLLTVVILLRKQRCKGSSALVGGKVCQTDPYMNVKQRAKLISYWG
jgi:hypothetical protein